METLSGVNEQSRMARTLARTFARQLYVRAGRRKKRKRVERNAVTPDVQSRSHPRARVPAARSVSSYDRLTRGCTRRNEEGRGRRRQKERRQWICIKVGAHGGFLVPCFSALPRFPRGRSRPWRAVSARPLPPDRRLLADYVTAKETSTETIRVPLSLSLFFSVYKRSTLLFFRRRHASIVLKVTK